jgi:hypothetical protein
MTNKVSKEPIVVDPAMKVDPKSVIKAKRDYYQKELDRFVKEAQANINRLEGAIASCNDLIADMEKKPEEPPKE